MKSNEPGLFESQPILSTSNPEIKETRYKKGQKPKTPEEQLKLAMWFLSMFDTPEEAVQVLASAKEAVMKVRTAKSRT